MTLRRPSARPWVDRRRLCLGLTVLAFAGAGAAGASEQAASPLDGTWGGADQGDTAQVIVSGGVVLGFFWRDDYVDAANSELSTDGRILTFRFPGGRATLRRASDDTATLEVSEGRGVHQFVLRRD